MNKGKFYQKKKKKKFSAISKEFANIFIMLQVLKILYKLFSQKTLSLILKRKDLSFKFELDYNWISKFSNSTTLPMKFALVAP